MFRRFLPLFAVLLLALAPTANAQIYLRLAGENQGPIDGEVVLGPLTGTIATSTFSLSISTPIDPVSGLPSGAIQVSPLFLSKGLDSSTIGLLRAMSDTEVLTTCFLDAYRDDGAGGTELYLRISLTGARVESWSISGSTGSRPGESVSLTFDTLEWRDFITGEIYSYSMGLTSVNPALEKSLGLVSTPNPTAGETEFSFRLPTSAEVSIEVYDVRGRHVSTVFDGDVGADRAVVSWDGRDDQGQPVATGIYLVKMRAGQWLTTSKMAVVR